MIVGAAVCPGAPFLIDGTADAVAERLRPIGSACAEAISRFPTADEVLLITAGRPASNGIDGPGHAHRAATVGWRLLVPGTPVSASLLRRSDVGNEGSIVLPGRLADDRHRSRPIGHPPSVGTIVGANLLAGAPSPVPPTTGIEVTGDPNGAATAVFDRVHSERRVAILVIADGSACHGDTAPGRRDDRATLFDAALAAALAAGDPAALAAVSRQRELAGELLATVDPLTVLAALTANTPPNDAELLYSEAPLGVGYLIASWRWGVT